MKRPAWEHDKPANRGLFCDLLAVIALIFLVLVITK
jgi:hypothetical protein